MRKAASHMTLWKSFILSFGISILSAKSTSPNQNVYSSSSAEFLPANCDRLSGNSTLAWHPRRVDHREFTILKTLQHDRLQVVTHPEFDVPVLIKVSNSPCELPSMEQEIMMYQLLDGSGATPELLGHVIKDGQSVGFVSEYIEEVPSMRTRTSHLKGCLDALRILHRRGIAHGDAHDGNCLIRNDGTAVLIDFELSLETWARVEFDRDLDIMGRCIQQTVSEL